jgi:hypothetical protein
LRQQLIKRVAGPIFRLDHQAASIAEVG